MGYVSKASSAVLSRFTLRTIREVRVLSDQSWKMVEMHWGGTTSLRRPLNPWNFWWMLDKRNSDVITSKPSFVSTYQSNRATSITHVILILTIVQSRLGLFFYVLGTNLMSKTSLALYLSPFDYSDYSIFLKRLHSLHQVTNCIVISTLSSTLLETDTRKYWNASDYIYVIWLSLEINSNLTGNCYQQIQRIVVEHAFLIYLLIY